MTILQSSIAPPTGGYQISRSLRFNSADSTYLNRTPASNGNRQIWTLSFWMKRSTLATNGSLFGAGSNGSNYFLFYMTNGDVIRCEEAVSGVNTWIIVTTPVYRDPSSWYHILMAFDSPQATSSNRIKMYVNGVQVTAFSTATYPTQNLNSSYWNATSSHNIGAAIAAGVAYGNGYMTEINFIDGQALTPSSFGQTNASTGVWEPVKYTGTYGTNGFYLPMSAGTTWSGYFDGSNDYLSVASNAAWQYGTGDFTVECWLLGTSSGALSNQYPLGRYNTSAGAYGALQIGNSTTIYWYYGNGAAYTFTLGTALTTDRWYHFAVSRSGTSLRFFLDGTQIGSTQTDSTNYSGTAEFRIVNAHQSSATYFPGYISNVRVVKGSAVYTTNFTPSTTPLTAITNTVLLTCQSSTFIDNSTNNFTITNNGGAITQQFSPFLLDVTDDHSGQGNHWIPNNLDLRTTGVGADILVDSPTSYGTDTGVGGEVRGNYCTLNPLVPRGASTTFSNGNLTYTNTAGSADQYVFEGWNTITSQYYECTATTVAASSLYIYAGDNAGYYCSNGQIYINGSLATTVATYTSGDVLGFAVTVGGIIRFYKNGTLLYTSSGIAAGSPLCNGFSSTVWNFNFGQRAFDYTAPSGFKALCTQNLPTPTITKGNQYFDVLTWSGTGGSSGATRSITGLNFQPDFLWEKARSSGSGHQLLDVVRGVGQNKVLASNSTGAEPTPANTESLYGWLSSFNSDGFTTTNGTSTWDNWNKSGDTYVAWNWKANGAGSSNTAGNITSTVSVNTTSGFSIVTYTGNGSANQTVGHGLGVAPAFGILKDRDTNSNNNQWQVFHTAAGDKYGYLSTTAGFTGTAEFYPTSGSSTTVTVGRGSPVATSNESGDRYVMYLFRPVAGYSAFGSFTGNNSLSDGPFVYLGFRPAFLLIKRSDSTSDWFMLDNDRPTFNVIGAGNGGQLAANQTYTESTLSVYAIADFLSNGFKVRHDMTYGYWNVSGGTYIYAAFAESPFKYSLAR